MTAMLSSGASMGDAGSFQVAPQTIHGPALQLLLRFLPFGVSSKANNSHTEHQNRHTLMEELHKNPLWRFSSMDEQRPMLQGVLRGSTPHEAHNTLLSYVRMAAEAEQRPRATHEHRRSSQLSAAEAAAELHALYTLAVVQVASQQQQQEACKDPTHKQQQLSDGDILSLLKAYASLESPKSSSNGQQQQEQQRSHRHSGGSWDSSSAQTAAAAVQALYAFAQMAESAQQEQQAPGQLKALKTSAAAGKPALNGSKQASSSSSSDGAAASGHTSSYDRQQQDLHVLLQLAQLGSQP